MTKPWCSNIRKENGKAKKISAPIKCVAKKLNKDEENEGRKKI